MLLHPVTVFWQLCWHCHNFVTSLWRCYEFCEHFWRLYDDFDLKQLAVWRICNDPNFEICHKTTLKSLYSFHKVVKTCLTMLKPSTDYFIFWVTVLWQLCWHCHNFVTSLGQCYEFYEHFLTTQWRLCSSWRFDDNTTTQILQYAIKLP